MLQTWERKTNASLSSRTRLGRRGYGRRGLKQPAASLPVGALADFPLPADYFYCYYYY